jgi:hypothetical protein
MKLIIAIAAALLGMTTITTSASAQWATSGHPHPVAVRGERGFRAQEPWREQLAIRTEQLAIDAQAFTAFATNVVSYPHTNREGAEFVSRVRAFDREARSGASLNELNRTLGPLAAEQREFSQTMVRFLSTADMNPTIAEVHRLARRLNESMDETRSFIAQSERMERQYVAPYPYRMYPYERPGYAYRPSRVERIPGRGYYRVERRAPRVTVRFGH